MRSNEVVLELAKQLYGDSNWESISSVSKQCWVEKAERAIEFLEPLIVADLGPKLHYFLKEYQFGEDYE